MKRQRRLNAFVAIFFLGILLFSLGEREVLAAPVSIATTSTVAVTPTLAFTPTPVVENGVEPQAWLDGSMDVEHFAPNGEFIVHFNTPMDTGFPTPLLSWPAFDGQSRWNGTGSTLTFKPAQRLGNNAAYTFFLNPTLRSKNGKSLQNPPEWQIQTQLGPQIVDVSPSAGNLDRRYREIEITFDQNMDAQVDPAIISIAPSIPFKLKWKTVRVLQIQLEKPFAFGQQYHLTVHNGLASTNGSYLENEFDWDYQQLLPQAKIESLTKTDVKIAFNYLLKRQGTEPSFSISPTLDGKWSWISNDQVLFKSSAPIPADKIYTISYTSPLQDVNGIEVTGLEKLNFSGMQPIQLLADSGGSDKKYKIRENTYDDVTYYYAGYDTEAIQLEFLVPINHNTAEKAFSLTPTVPGTIAWEKGSQGRDVLVYRLNQQLENVTNYTIQLNTSVRSEAGQPLIAEPFIKTIGVNDYRVGPCFGDLGSNIQVLDVQGARRLQYAPGQKEASFSAYRIDLIDFVKLYPPLRSRSSAGVKIPIQSGSKPVATWSNSTKRDVGDRQPIVETTLPSSLEPGLYVVNAYAEKKLYDQMFVVLTRNTLVVKDNGHKVTAWVTDINGKAVEKAEIRVYNARGEKIREGQSDENGLYSVSVPAGETAVLVAARVRESHKPDDVTISALDLEAALGNANDWFSSWFSSWESDDSRVGFEDPGYGLPVGSSLVAYTYTDRPVYRPGQTINFKAILRQDDDMRYSLPAAGTPVTVRVRDGRGNILHTLTLTTNDFGSVHGDFLVPDGAMLGKYTIETEFNGLRDSQYFRVEDYRKPDYQVTVTSLQPEKRGRYVRGEDVKVQIHAAYYFGEPVAGAELKADTFREFTISSNISGEPITDAEGNATLTIQAPYDDPGYYSWWGTGKQHVRLQISADDGSHQSIAGQYYFEVYPSTDQLDMDTGGYFAQPGQSITVKISDMDIFDQPVAGRELTLSVQDWSRTTYEFATTSQNLPVTTDTEGKASLQITLKSGYHQLSLTGKDALGNTIEKRRWVYVFKDKNDWFQNEKGAQLSISTEKDSYKPYEKAHLIIESTFSGPAWLTFERGSVINSKLIELTAPLTIIETDIIPEHAPNVFVTVNAWQAASTVASENNYDEGTRYNADSYMRIARTHIYVDASNKALEIEIKPEKQIYSPGETVNAKIQVKDAAGQPVLAELSLAVVDESIFALTKDNIAPIFEAFYSPRGLALSTYDSMAPWRYIYSPEFGGGGNETPPEPRDNFQDTSTWLPTIETDANGQASVQFKLPDNTTRWRLSVKAVTRQNQVGQAQEYLETKKELFLRASLPRILTQGDSATLTAFVYNYSSTEQKAQVSLNAPGLELLTDAEQQVTIQAEQALQVNWQVKVKSSAPTHVTIRARASDNLQDGVLLPLNIQPATVSEIQTLSGQVNGELLLALNLPQVDKESSRVTLALNRSLSGTLLNGLEYLTGYPYGCVEQTMSRALPNAVVAHAEKELGLGNTGLQASLPPLIQASLVKLYGLQHSDGGWGWWYDDNTDTYQTAWVLFGLSVIRDSGYAVEPDVIQQAVKSLKYELRESNNLDLRLRAYVLYGMARAGYGDREATLKLAQESGEQLDPFSQAALALALNRLDEKQKARDLLVLLSQRAAKQSETVYWSQASLDGVYHNKTMSSSLRTTALALQAYVEIDPHNQLIPGTVRYLVSKRKGIEGWGTTNETSYTILALTEYLKAQTQDQNVTSYKVLLNGKSLAAGALDVGQTSANLEIPLAQLAGGANSLKLETQGGAPIYYDLTTQYHRTKAPSQAAGNIQISRRYLNPRTKTVIDQPQAGQLVQVELTIEVPEDVSYLALEDYLPGGLEALNEGLNISQRPGTTDFEDGIFFADDYGYNYKEIRGDRVVFFFTSLDKGKHTYTYMAHAATLGQFTALPAQVYAMYDARLWGRSEIGKIVIK
jgi:uncharacterized protein YfaS (alpha-2-macroglobulin family)